MVATALDHGMTPGYRVLPEWERLPAGYRHGDVVGVAVDSRDRVFVLTRRDARCIIYEPDGTFVGSFGEDVFTERIHALTIDDDDFVYTVDDGDPDHVAVPVSRGKALPLWKHGVLRCHAMIERCYHYR